MKSYNNYETRIKCPEGVRATTLNSEMTEGKIFYWDFHFYTIDTEFFESI